MKAHVVLSLALLLTACGGGGDDASPTAPPTPNIAPVAIAGLEQTVYSGVSVTLTGTGSDSDGNIASYQWTQVSGAQVASTNDNTSSVSFISPVTVSQEKLVFKLTVTDDDGATGVDEVSVIVNPPLVITGTDQVVSDVGTVTLGSTLTDSASKIASYLWEQISGPTVSLINGGTATASFVAPVVTNEEILVFRLTVTDEKGTTTTDDISVIINHVNRPPVANANAPTAVDEGMTVSLSGSAHDGDGSVVAYLWTQVSGSAVTLSDGDTATASFVAPATAGMEILVFKLTVTDNEGATHSVDVSITVNHINLAPVVNAGAEQQVDEKNNVTLTGSATDSDGSIASYQWTQISGVVVTLLNADTATTTFDAPDTASQEVLTFKLTVTDDKGLTASDELDVTVNHVNVAPIADAGTAQVVDSLATVTLAGSATDSDGSIASYKWTQISGTAVTLTNADYASASFVAPIVTVEEMLLFELTVADDKGATHAATVSVTVFPVALEVVVEETINVYEGMIVPLVGSATSKVDSITSYQWTQTLGDTVALSNDASPLASFTAPKVTEPKALEFSLTTTDNSGLEGSATTTVIINPITAVKLSSSSLGNCAITYGKLQCWGRVNDYKISVPDGLKNPIQIAAGENHSCAIDDNGVQCWGANNDVKTDVPEGLIKPSQVAVGGYHSCAIDDNGVQCWGSNNSNQLDAPFNLKNPRQLSLGEYNSCALDDTGVHCWGNNTWGNSSVPAELINPVEVAAGKYNTCVIDDNGVQCWGEMSSVNDVPQGLINPRQIGVNDQSACVLDDNGVQCWTSSYNIPDQLSNPIQISTGGAHGCVLDDNGIQCWGSTSRSTFVSSVPDESLFIHRADFSLLFDNHVGGELGWSDNTLLNGSALSMTINNSLDRTFTIPNYRLFNGETVHTTITDPSLLNNNQLAPGDESLTVSVTLNSHTENKEFIGKFELEEPETGIKGQLSAVIAYKRDYSADFAEHVSTSVTSDISVINSYIQAGSQFDMTITNSSDKSFAVDTVKFFNGTTLINESSEATLLNGNSLAPGESITVNLTLETQQFKYNVTSGVLYLRDKSSQQSGNIKTILYQ